MNPLPRDLLSGELKARARRHEARHGHALSDIRLRTEARFQHEIERLCDGFVEPPLRAGARPIATLLAEYAGWLGWSFWCSSHLAPPLGLLGDADVRRFAAAMVVYAGPRLMDDALDNHRSYKGKRETAVAAFERAFPRVDEAARRSHLVLAGAWLTLHGLERLRRHGCPGAAERTQRLCGHIAPGVLVEGLNAAALDWAAYEHLVLLKSVRYDRILYLNLLDPTPDPDRTAILCATAHLSRLAQYLNDVSDFAQDAACGQANVCQWFAEPEAIRRLCGHEMDALEEALAAVPEEVGDALAAAANETVEAACRLHARDRENP